MFGGGRSLRRFIFIAAAVVICGASADAHAGQFLSAETEHALSARTEFLKKIDLTDAEFLVFGQWILGQDRAQFADKLSYQSGSGNVWYYFLSGLMNPNAASTFFREAQTAALSDLGTLWLLSLEFLRNDQAAWAASGLTELEKNIFALGASSAPLLSRQLMLFGSILAPDYPADAEFCYTWAKRFDKDQPWWIYKLGQINSPKNLASAIPAFIVDAGGIFFRSWKAQVAFAHGVCKLFAASLFIFMCTVFLVYLIKYLPSGVHVIGDTLFGGASPRYRTVSSIILVLSVLSFGVIPFLWVCAFLIRRFLSAPEKKLFTCACAILALCPLYAIAENAVLRHTAPASAAVVFDRIVKEGYSDDLHRAAAELIEKKPDSYLGHLAFALSSAKNANYRQSAETLRRAHQLEPFDPMVLMYAGSISFWAGNPEAMEQFLSQLLQYQPKNAAAIFNLAQAQFADAGFTASDRIADAAKMDPGLISEFMKVNDHYYGNDTPPLRRLIQTSITPSYFWTRVFLSDLGEAVSAARPMFGVNPLAVFALFAVLFAALLIVDAAIWDNSARSGKKYFICRICGRVLCRRCRKGTMCLTCYKASLDSHNNASAIYNMQKKCQDDAALAKELTRRGLGMLAPGADRLYKGDGVWGPAAAMFAASAVFAALYCAATFGSGYPSRVVIDPIYYVSVLLVYNAVAIVKNCGGVVSALQNYAKQKAKQGL